MSARRAVAAAVAILLLVGPAGAQEVSQPLDADQAPRFRSSVELVSVAAVVRDRKGRFVFDLSRHDFEVVEAGTSKPIVGFHAERNGPVRIAVLFDISGSMRVSSRAVDARQAARHVLSGLQSGDLAALFAFDTQLQQVRKFTADFAGLEAALDHVDPPFGQTSLYDAVAETSRVVAAEAGHRGDGVPQRAAVVVLTDGIDTRSRLTPPEVSGIASGIDVPVYVIAVMSAIDDPARAANDEKERGDKADTVSAGWDSGLRNLARWTGGELFTVTAPAHASVAARQIVSELRNQYLLAFAASSQPGWKPLQIRARDRDLVVRARSGYRSGGARPSSGMAAEGGSRSPAVVRQDRPGSNNPGR